MVLNNICDNVHSTRRYCCVGIFITVVTVSSVDRVYLNILKPCYVVPVLQT